MRPASDARAEFSEKVRLSAGTLLPPLLAISRRLSSLIEAKPRFGELSLVPIVILQTSPPRPRLRTDDLGRSSRLPITYWKAADLGQAHRLGLSYPVRNAGIIKQNPYKTPQLAAPGGLPGLVRLLR